MILQWYLSPSPYFFSDWQWPYCEGLSTYTQIFSPKKTGFSPVKNSSQFFFDFCLPLSYATFQCGPYNIFKKSLNKFFAHENLKKRASKVAHNRPSPQPKIDFSYYRYVPRRICLLICAFWVCTLMLW